MMGATPRKLCPMERRQAAECGNKKRYYTRNDALHAVKMMRRFGRERIALDAYKCEWCGNGIYHIGNDVRRLPVEDED